MSIGCWTPLSAALYGPALNAASRTGRSCVCRPGVGLIRERLSLTPGVRCGRSDPSRSVPKSPCRAERRAWLQRLIQRAPRPPGFHRNWIATALANTIERPVTHTVRCERLDSSPGGVGCYSQRGLDRQTLARLLVRAPRERCRPKRRPPRSMPQGPAS